MAAPPPSLLDYEQILPRVFDEPNGRLRVDAQVTWSGGAIEVIIDQTTDSIRIGDGTTLFTGTTVGSKTGLDVNVLNGASAAIPFIQNVQANSSGTEYSVSFPNDLKSFFIKARLGQLKVAYVSGDTGIEYFTVRKGGIYEASDLQVSGLVLYFQSNVDNDVIEAHGWTS